MALFNTFTLHVPYCNLTVRFSDFVTDKCTQAHSDLHSHEFPRGVQHILNERHVYDVEGHTRIGSNAKNTIDIIIKEHVLDRFTKL